MIMDVFWDITQWGSLKVGQSFRGTCHLHFQGRRVSQAKSLKSSACYQPHSVFLLGVLFSPEKDGNMLLQNLDWRSVDYLVLYPRR
jgi:hypothetical protein